MGYIFVTRECWGFVGFAVLVEDFWITFCNPQMMEFCGVCGGCVGYIFVTREYMGRCLEGEITCFVCLTY